MDYLARFGYLGGRCDPRQRLPNRARDFPEAVMSEQSTIKGKVIG